MKKPKDTNLFFFKFSRASNFSCRRCGRFVKFSFHRIQYRWRELFFSWALFIVVVLLLAAVYLFYSRLIKKLDRKNKKKNKKNRAWSLLNSVYCAKNTMNWYKVQAVVVLCVGIYTQFPHKIKRLTPYLFMFINLGEKYFSKLEKKKGGSKFIVVYYSWQDICHPCIFLIGVYLFVSNWYFSPRVVNNKVKRQL